MMQQSAKRVIGRHLAKELTPEEQGLVAGGYEGESMISPTTSYTEITGDRRTSDTVLD
ncbi:MAG: hypothetical protein JO013_05955 [Alphaproteobacteria bacterium]|nr:hypothetical protein [Alphaproteobacteria bacterium]